jgi:hypothetical protein
MLFESGLMPIPMEDLGAMLDTTTDFDWVSNTYVYFPLQNYVVIQAQKAHHHMNRMLLILISDRNINRQENPGWTYHSMSFRLLPTLILQLMDDAIEKKTGTFLPNSYKNRFVSRSQYSINVSAAPVPPSDLLFSPLAMPFPMSPTRPHATRYPPLCSTFSSGDRTA